MKLTPEQQKRKLADISKLESVAACDGWANGNAMEGGRPFKGEAEALQLRRMELEKAGAMLPKWKQRGRK